MPYRIWAEDLSESLKKTYSTVPGMIVPGPLDQ